MSRNNYKYIYFLNISPGRLKTLHGRGDARAARPLGGAGHGEKVNGLLFGKAGCGLAI